MSTVPRIDRFAKTKNADRRSNLTKVRSDFHYVRKSVIICWHHAWIFFTGQRTKVNNSHVVSKKQNVSNEITADFVRPLNFEVQQKNTVQLQLRFKSRGKEPIRLFTVYVKMQRIYEINFVHQIKTLRLRKNKFY